MKIFYLDQNKWIELARAAKFPAERPEVTELLKTISSRVQSGQLALPLAAANIYETFKVNDPQRRRALAFIQAKLSRGLVFRGRYHRLEAEIAKLLRVTSNDTPNEEDWFLSNIFFEAFLDSGDERLENSVSADVVRLIRNNPEFFLYDYLANSSDEIRISAVENFSRGSENLRKAVESRREKHKNESVSMRRRLYSALLLIDEIDLVLRITRKLGMPWSTVGDIGEHLARRIITDVPTYYIERELALRLEAHNRNLEENDFRDMQTFCTVIPYADRIIAENLFVNIAKQAGLERKFNKELGTNILNLRDALQ